MFIKIKTSFISLNFSFIISNFINGNFYKFESSSITTDRDLHSCQLRKRHRHLQTSHIVWNMLTHLTQGLKFATSYQNKFDWKELTINPNDFLNHFLLKRACILFHSWTVSTMPLKMANGIFTLAVSIAFVTYLK